MAPRLRCAVLNRSLRPKAECLSTGIGYHERRRRFLPALNGRGFRAGRICEKAHPSEQ
jgi:hypothetical protein